MQIKSTIICDSVFNGNRITTFEIEYPRFIHSEFMTHRVFSRNAMSSRAVPIEKMIDQVKTDPAMPVEWGLNRSGMQSDEYHPHWEVCEEVWKECAFYATQNAKELQELGLHKQIVNRVLEPFQMMKTVVTATEWDNFFELRTHKDTQPEFQALAKLMKEQYDTNTPQELYEGYWHLPYVETWVHPDAYQGIKGLYKVNGEVVSEEDAIKISASCCAQVSYRVNDNSLDKALKIYDKLITSVPKHCSPFENQAKASEFSGSFTVNEMAVERRGVKEGITHFDTKGNYWSGNFKNWIQYRQLL